MFLKDGFLRVVNTGDCLVEGQFCTKEDQTCISNNMYGISVWGEVLTNLEWNWGCFNQNGDALYVTGYPPNL